MRLRVSRRYVPLLATAGVFLAVFVAAGTQFDNFLTLNNFVNLLTRGSFLGLCAVGMTFVIIAGGIDLSVGAMVAFSSILIASLTSAHGVPGWAAIALTLVVGVVFGLAQGSVIHYFKAPAFIVTLAGMFLLRGAGFVLSLTSIPIEDPILVALSGASVPIGGAALRVGAMTLLLAVAAAAIALGWTKFGRNVYAIGGSETSVLLMGIPLARTKLAIYAVSGLCSALAGVIFVIETASGDPSTAVGLELEAIAAVVIGGTLLTGGFGYVAGTLVGVLIRQVIYTIIEFNGHLNVYWAKIVVGSLLLAFILLQRVFSQGTAAGRATARRRTQPLAPRLTLLEPAGQAAARAGAEKP